MAFLEKMFRKGFATNVAIDTTDPVSYYQVNVRSIAWLSIHELAGTSILELSEKGMHV